MQRSEADGENGGSAQGQSTDEYMSDPSAKTIGGFIRALEIMAKYVEGGLNHGYFLSPAHDIIYAGVGIDELPPESEDGKLLTALGWHADSDAWAYFT